MGESSAKKKKGEMRMIKQNRGNQNKFIYNNKNAYLSVPLLMMSARRMNLCKEKKKGWGWGGGGRKTTKKRERKKADAILFEQNSQSQMNNNNNKFI